ncbi:MAG: DUF2169 domain-containing protein, partial [Myxococcales bacterium]|nr:DUF2169 domain-containing protein [Myxococcales bacterium]
RWESRFRGLSASDPEPFEPLPLSWNLAFGGTDHRPPGWDHASRLPHPGGPVPYVLNPSGQGFIYDVEQAEGRSLPQIELPGALVRDPGDRPVPAGFAPCPNLMALRAAAIVGEGLSLQSASMREELDKHLDLQHHVAPSCVFPSLAVDERITVLGLGTRPVVVVPRCPSSLRLPGRSARCRLRDVHIDADHAVARLTWTFGRRFDREAPPRRLTLEMAA